MNYGIINNRRRERSNDEVNPLLQDPRMREIAKQMGLEPKHLGKEAQEIWHMLDGMAASDPKAYQEFIHEQLKDGPPSNEPRKLTYFTPQAGFVIKCIIVKPHAGVKMFLNICAHEVIDMPKNPNTGQNVPPDTRDVPTTNNLQVPLVVGTERDVRDAQGQKCRAVDVIFHPWVLQRCEWDANFKREVLKLAMYWVQSDAKVSFDLKSGGKFIKSKYKGGVTIGGEILTSKFHIDNSGENQQGEAQTNRLRTETPLELLQQRHKQEEEQAQAELTKIRISSTDNQAGNQDGMERESQKKLIEVIDSSEPSSELNPIKPSQYRPIENERGDVKPAIREVATKSTIRNKKTPAVKKGFLNSSKCSLYPEGSKEGRPASSYVRLMERSKVVDMSDMEKSQREQQQRVQESRNFFSSLAPDSNTSKVSNTAELDHGDYEFEQLCQEADPDWIPENRQRSNIDPAQQMFGENWDLLTKSVASST